VGEGGVVDGNVRGLFDGQRSRRPGRGMGERRPHWSLHRARHSAEAWVSAVAHAFVDDATLHRSRDSDVTHEPVDISSRDRPPLLGVQARSWLVEDQQFGAPQGGLGQPEALTHPPRQGADPSPRYVNTGRNAAATPASTVSGSCRQPSPAPPRRHQALHDRNEHDHGAFHSPPQRWAPRQAREETALGPGRGRSLRPSRLRASVTKRSGRRGDLGPVGREERHAEGGHLVGDLLRAGRPHRDVAAGVSGETNRGARRSNGSPAVKPLSSCSFQAWASPARSKRLENWIPSALPLTSQRSAVRVTRAPLRRSVGTTWVLALVHQQAKSLGTKGLGNFGASRLLLRSCETSKA
jgi:hypothetical protein